MRKIIAVGFSPIAAASEGTSKELAHLVGLTLRAIGGIRATQTYTYLRIHKLAHTWSGSGA